MDTDDLKIELLKLPLEVLEPLFDEILLIKEKELREKRMYYANIQKLQDIFGGILGLAEHYQKVISIFDVIGCETENFVFDSKKLINNLTVRQIIESDFVKRLPRRRTFFLKGLSPYQQELVRYFERYGEKICSSQYIRVIRNSLIVKEIIRPNITQEAILDEIHKLFGV